MISVLKLFPQNEKSTVNFKGIILMNIFQYHDKKLPTHASSSFGDIICSGSLLNDEEKGRGQREETVE